MQNLSDLELMKLVLSNHSYALEQIYDRYAKLVYSFALKSTKDELVARDIVQLVFTRLWTTERSYDATKGKFINWLLTITRNITIDLIRREKKHSVSAMMQWEQWEKVPDDTLILQEDMIFREDLKQQIQHACRFLTVSQARLIEDLYWGGYTLSEIAQTYNEPVGTVKSRLHQSLKILRKHLQEGGINCARE